MLFQFFLAQENHADHRHEQQHGDDLKRERVLREQKLAERVGFAFWHSLSQTSLPATPTAEGGTLDLGRLLFTSYTLPFEILSVLLLVAMVGVILISKKDLK